MKIFRGEVIHGKKVGRKMGFPTANIEFEGDLDEGVYLGLAKIDEKKYKAGIIRKDNINILEAYILDFSEEIYGKTIELEVGTRIREIIRFKTDKELIAQIKKDIEIIKK